MRDFMKRINQSGGPWDAGGKSPVSDLEKFLRGSLDKLRTALPGGGLGGKGIGLIALAAVGVWGFSGFFQVDPDELGVVLRFGQYVRDAEPGLGYHLPYPVESVLTPKITRVNRIDVGMRGLNDAPGVTARREVPEESLMLTGDENIVDIDFSVF
jgi:modulator of FtsH protease HflK